MARLRTLTLVGFALALAMAASSLAAQDKKDQGGGGREGTQGVYAPSTRLYFLLRSEPVAREIKLTLEDKRILAEIEKGLEDLPFPKDIKGQSEQERHRVFTEAREKRQKAVAEAEKNLDGILNPEQVKRLDEIYIQQRGVKALKHEKFAKALKLSDEQASKIDLAITRGQFEDGRLHGGGATKSPEELREKLEKLQKEVDTKVLAVLTDAQKEQFEKMKGAPFTPKP